MADSTVYAENVAIKAQVRAAGSTSNLNENQLDFPVINNRREQITSQGLPERAEVVRLGDSWGTMTTVAVAAVTAMPTTAAHFAMRNGEAANGKAYIIDEIFYVVTTASGAAGGATIAVCNQRGAFAALSSPQTPVIGNASGKGLYGGFATFKDSQTVVDHGWFVVKTIAQSSDGTIAVGSSLVAEVNGSVIIAPGGALGIAVLAVNATLAGKIGVRWHECKVPVNQ